MNKYNFRYRMNFTSSWLTAYCTLCGAAVFSRCLYFFMFANLAAIGVGQIIFDIILPLLLLCGLIVIVKVIRMDAPGILAILGCVMCLLLIINGFDTRNVLRLVFSLLGYAGGGALLLLTVAGFLPKRRYNLVLFVVLTGLRFLLLRPAGGVLQMLPEISDLCMLLSLGVLPMGMRKLD